MSTDLLPLPPRSTPNSTPTDRPNRADREATEERSNAFQRVASAVGARSRSVHAAGGQSGANRREPDAGSDRDDERGDMSTDRGERPTVRPDKRDDVDRRQERGSSDEGDSAFEPQPQQAAQVVATPGAASIDGAIVALTATLASVESVPAAASVAVAGSSIVAASTADLPTNDVSMPSAPAAAAAAAGTASITAPAALAEPGGSSASSEAGQPGRVASSSAASVADAKLPTSAQALPAAGSPQAGEPATTPVPTAAMPEAAPQPTSSPIDASRQSGATAPVVVPLLATTDADDGSASTSVADASTSTVDLAGAPIESPVHKSSATASAPLTETVPTLDPSIRPEPQRPATPVASTVTATSAATVDAGAALRGSAVSAAATSEDANTPRIVSAARMLHRGPGAPSTMTVTLDPERLGKVRVELSTLDGELAVRLHAEHAQGVQAIGAGLANLRSALVSEGLRLGDLGVGLAGSGSGSDGQFEANRGGADGQQSPGNSRALGGRSSDSNASGATDPRTPAARRAVIGNGRLDADL